MIVVTLLLILVAVTLLVLGLADGASTMLIGSIVASLLAAVALVIGARRAATLRRAAEGVPASPADDAFLSESPSPAEFATAGARTSTGPGPGGTHTGQGARAARRAAAPAPSEVVYDEFAPPPPPAATGPGDYPPPPPAATVVHEDFPPPPGPAADYAPPGREDFLPPPPGSSSSEAYADEFPPPPPAAARAARPARDADSDFSASDPILDDEDDDDLLEPEPGRRAPDYDRASSTIDSARAEGRPEAWRTDPTLTDPGTRPAEPFDDEAPLLLDDPAPAPGATAPSTDAPAEEEFDEADDDDPEDEPLPQAVHPGDAVQVARMDAEVLVVDGRPRYHMADCPHLVGRLTEGLPVSEAVELGFNPCGLCRPVDRLVARANHH